MQTESTPDSLDQQSATGSVQQSKERRDYHRLFCLLPRSIPMEYRDELFFKEFARFGRLEYYQTMPDRQEPMRWGCMRYVEQIHASKALV